MRRPYANRHLSAKYQQLYIGRHRTEKPDYFEFARNFDAWFAQMFRVFRKAEDAIAALAADREKRRTKHEVMIVNRFGRYMFV